MSSSQAQNKMQRAFLLHVVIRQCSCMLSLRSCQEEKKLLVWRNTFLILGVATVSVTTFLALSSVQLTPSALFFIVVVRDGNSPSVAVMVIS